MRNATGSMALVVVTLTIGCFEENTVVDPTAANGSTAAGSETTTGGLTETTTTLGPSTEAGPTTQSTTQTSLDETGTDSTGTPVPTECDDGVAAPGELCLGVTKVVMANGATCCARIGDVAGTPSRDLVYLIPDQVVVRVGNGNGNFGPAVFDASVVAEHLQLADFDGDGELDLVVLESVGTLRLLLGSGSGSFAGSGQAAVGTDPRALAVGDLDGDGNLDVVVGTGTGELHAVLGDGSGALLPGAAVPSFSPVTGLALADVDGDGTLDLVIALGGGGWPGVALRRGQGDGTFGGQEPTSGPQDAVGDVATGDFDGDGLPDVAYVSAVDDVLGVLLGNGDGSFHMQLAAATGPDPSVLLAVDLDNDGHPELVVGHAAEHALRIYGIGGIEPGSEPPGRLVERLQVPLAAPVSALHAGDLNGDGVPDLAATSSAAAIVTLVLSTP